MRATNANEAKVYQAHATPKELCDNLINALKLLANQQKYCLSLHEISEAQRQPPDELTLRADCHC